MGWGRLPRGPYSRRAGRQAVDGGMHGQEERQEGGVRACVRMCARLRVWWWWEGGWGVCVWGGRIGVCLGVCVRK